MIRKCPLCLQETSWENNPFRPFCSERCQIIDLGAWASEDYAIPEDPATQSSLSPDDEDI